jgi:predicted ABC-type ATPase
MPIATLLSAGTHRSASVGLVALRAGVAGHLGLGLDWNVSGHPEDGAGVAEMVAVVGLVGCEHRGVLGELLVVTGPPGAGKSTVATLLVTMRTPSVLVEGDGFFRFLREARIDPWLAEDDAQNSVVAEAAGSATGRFVQGGYWTVYDGVVGPWSLQQFMAAARLPRLHYVILLPDVETCVARVAARVGHRFTDEDATRHMHSQFEQAEVDRRHILRDAPAAADAIAATIGGLVDAEKIAFIPEPRPGDGGRLRVEAGRA